MELEEIPPISSYPWGNLGEELKLNKGGPIGEQQGGHKAGKESTVEPEVGEMEVRNGRVQMPGTRM